MMFRILLLIALMFSFSVPSFAAKGGRWLNQDQVSPGISKGKHKKTELSGTDTGGDTESDVVPPPDAVNTSPQISIISPVANAVFSVGDTMTALVTAQDAESEIAFCDMSINGLHVFRDSLAPFEVDITSNAALAAGEYQLVATCADSTELTSSAVVAFSVAEPVPVPAIEANHAVVLDWIAPATRSDGAALLSAEIASFEVYFHTSGNFGNGISEHIPAWDSAGNLVTDHIIENLPMGSYLFSIAVVDTEGRVSEFSEPVTLSLP